MNRGPPCPEEGTVLGCFHVKNRDPTSEIVGRSSTEPAGLEPFLGAGAVHTGASAV